MVFVAAAVALKIFPGFFGECLCQNGRTGCTPVVKIQDGNGFGIRRNGSTGKAVYAASSEQDGQQKQQQKPFIPQFRKA
jgi:hypothetical protein